MLMMSLIYIYIYIYISLFFGNSHAEEESELRREISATIPPRRNNHLKHHVRHEIPFNLIQTYYTQQIPVIVYEKIYETLNTNQDFQFMLITDEIGRKLIEEHFDTKTLEVVLHFGPSYYYNAHYDPTKPLTLVVLTNIYGIKQNRRSIV